MFQMLLLVDLFYILINQIQINCARFIKNNPVMINNLLISFFLSSLCVLLSGCGTLFAPSVSDLKFDSVSVVNLIDKANVIWVSGNSPSLDLLEIKFNSKNNLLLIARDHSFYLSSNVFYCSDGPEKYKFFGGFGALLGIYFSDGEVSEYKASDAGYFISPINNIYEYKIYIRIKRDYDKSFVQSAPPVYDLHNPSDDLCVNIHGVNMIGTYFDSNVITIPKQTILEVVQNHERYKTR